MAVEYRAPSLLPDEVARRCFLRFVVTQLTKTDSDLCHMPGDDDGRNAGNTTVGAGTMVARAALNKQAG
ncbi:MAG: hypothetical protein E5Y04_09320 [Mesorhizobium sp.]|uniref:hypothetical protein n=1 Tax=Mesorhizobium sp. M0088 TaxID=2956873 RepID=UPI000FE5E68E|nr:MAG: hypothetical protein EOR94_14515 [Mesorhizobium sp.]TJV25034.1 MAG: hypothetical protein E5Y04_09320 [Mesorhizobium sp.]